MRKFTSIFIVGFLLSFISVQAQTPVNALNFDGSDDYVQIPYSPTFNPANFTVEFWVKITGGAGNYRCPVSSRFWDGGSGFWGYNFYYTDADTWALMIGTGSSWDAIDYPMNAYDTWVHVAGVYDGTEIKLYINGDLKASKTSTYVPNAFTDLRIGSISDALNYFFNGEIDEVRIWSVAHNACDIRNGMNKHVSGFEQGLEAYYNFDQGVPGADNSAITSLPDMTANSNNGELYNFTLNGATSNWVASAADVYDSGDQHIQNTSYTYVTTSSVDINAEITAIGSGNATTRGVCYSLWPCPTIFDEVVSENGSFGLGVFTSDLTNLLIGKTYFVRPYTINSAGLTYGNEITVKLTPGNALSFDGNSDYVTTPVDADLDAMPTTTWEAWVKPEAPAGWGMIFCMEDGGWDRFLAVNGGYFTMGYTYDQWVIAPVEYSVWTHVAIVYNNGVMKFYKNGTLYTTMQDEGPHLSAGTFTIGANEGGVYNFYAGEIDEVRVWNTERTESEIITNMNRTLSGTETGLVAYYTFDHPAGSTILEDISGNGFDGTLVDMDPATDWVESFAIIHPIPVNPINITQTSFDLNWFPVDDATNYYIDVDDDFDFSSPLTSYTDLDLGTDTQISVTGLTPGTQYYYRVRSMTTKLSEYNEGDVTTRFAPPGNALSFDGIDDYAEVTGNDAWKLRTANYTIETWVLPDLTSDQLIFYHGVCGWECPSWTLSIGPEKTCNNPAGATGKFTFQSGSPGSDVIQSGFVNTGQWVHVAVSYDGANLKLYVNGVLEGTTPWTDIPYDNYYGFVGLDASYGCGVYRYPFSGDLDEIRIWSTSRTETELRANMYQMVDPASAGLRAYYTMDELPGTTTMNDVTGNGFNADLYNMDFGACWVESYAMVAPAVDTPASAVNLYGFTANWNAPITGVVENYYLEVSPDADFSGLLPDYGPKDCGTNLSEIVLVPEDNTDYYYRVRAYKSSVGDVGAYHYSSPVHVKTANFTPPGNAIDFDGTNDYISASPFTFQTSNITLEAWVNWNGTQTGNSEIIIYNGNTSTTGYGLILKSDDNYDIALLCGGVDIIETEIALTPDTWYHLALVNEAGIWTLYVNGVPNSFTSNPGFNAINTYEFGLIGGNDGGLETFPGIIDEVRVWETARTRCDIVGYMHTELLGDESDLVAYYNFNEGLAGGGNSGFTTLPDLTANSNDGTLDGFALIGATSNWIASTADVTTLNFYNDNLAPIPDETTLSDITGGCPLTIPIPTATDPCDGTITGTTTTPFPITMEGTTVVTWIYDDGHGNIVTQVQNIILDDVNAPVPDITTLPDVYLGCSDTAVAPTATDDCFGTVTATTTDPVTFGILGNYTIDWVYDDGNGNTTPQTQNVIVQDILAPVAPVISDTSVECSVTITAPIAMDACEGAITGTTTDPLTYDTQGTHTITWNFSDGSGNSSSTIQTVIVNDVTSPDAYSQDVTIQLDAAGNASVNVSSIDEGSSDNCGTAYLLLNKYDINVANGIYSGGNAEVVEYAFAGGADLYDDDLTADCDYEWGPQGSLCDQGMFRNNPDSLYKSNTDAGATWENSTNPGDGYGMLVVDMKEAYDLTTMSVFQMFSDGKTTHISAFYHTNTSSTAPLANDPGWIEIFPYTYVGEGTEDGDYVYDPARISFIPVNTRYVRLNAKNDGSLGDDSWIELSGIKIFGGKNALDFDCSEIGDNNITLLASDVNGNISTSEAIVTVEDVTAPVADAVSLPDLTDACSVALPAAPTATDMCMGTITGTTSTVFPVAATSVITWTFDDGNGNVSIQDQIVTISDVTAPVADVTALPDLTDACSVTPSYPTATDNCSGTITGTTTTDIPVLHSTVITWTYTDANGNISTQDQIVTITDMIAPVPDVTTLVDAAGDCSVTVTDIPTATDNCSGTISATTSDPLTYTATGTYTINWTYEDSNGNTATQTQTVEVTDAVSPVPDVISLPDLTDECSVNAPTAPTAADNCTGAITGTTTTTFPITSQGASVITWIFDDGNGNIATQDQNVIINDATDPVITCHTDTVIDLNAGETFYTVVTTILDPVITDNCINTTSINDFNSTSTLVNAEIPIGINSIEWTVTDDGGNVVTCTTIITVNPFVGINQDAIGSFVVSPNPTTGITYVTFNNSFEGTVTVTDEIGRVVLEKQVSGTELVLDLSELSNGIYMIELRNSNNVSYSRIIVE